MDVNVSLNSKIEEKREGILLSKKVVLQTLLEI